VEHGGRHRRRVAVHLDAPGEGIYHFVASINDWIGETPPEVLAPAQAAAPTQPDNHPSVARFAELAEHVYLPWVAADASSSGQGAGARIYLPLVANRRAITTSDYTSAVTTLYVDLAPPTIDIDDTFLTSTHEIGDNVVLLTGVAADGVKLHRVDIRINGGLWQRAGIDEEGNWQWQWWFDTPPDGQAFEVSARATDLAGHTTVVTKTVQVDLVAPLPDAIALAYVNRAGERLPVTPGATLTDASALEVSWAATSDGSESIHYEVGFSAGSTPAAADLTRYADAGAHNIPVSPGERWYATVRYVDGGGNTSTVTLGPVFIAAGQE
jgi:hypothetical protein